jgi:hypothetical protein
MPRMADLDRRGDDWRVNAVTLGVDAAMTAG